MAGAVAGAGHRRRLSWSSRCSICRRGCRAWLHAAAARCSPWRCSPGRSVPRLAPLPPARIAATRAGASSAPAASSHRPLTALDDRLSSAAATIRPPRALWQAHRARMAAASAPPARRLRRRPASPRRDPFALRVALGAAAADRRHRCRPAIGPQRLCARRHAELRRAAAPPPRSALDVWVTPPDYTGLPPQFLPPARRRRRSRCRPAARCWRRSMAAAALPHLKLDDAGDRFRPRRRAATYKGSADAHRRQPAGGRAGRLHARHLADRHRARPAADDRLRQAAAAAPQRAALRLEYQASDDYGVESVKAVITRPGDASGEVLALDLPLAGRASQGGARRQLSRPDARIPGPACRSRSSSRRSTRSARPATARRFAMTLPERAFHHPVARAIIEQRKQLTLDPTQREIVAETLSDLSVRPRLFGDDIVVFLALRTAQARLHARQATPRRSRRCSSCCGRPRCASRTAAASLVQRDLRDAMKQLQDALARNAPDAEIETPDARAAAGDRPLPPGAGREHAAPGRPGPEQRPIDPSQHAEPAAICRTCSTARASWRAPASRDAARNMLSQLQEMLENLQMARPGPDAGRPGHRRCGRCRT